MTSVHHWRNGWYFSRTGADSVVLEHRVATGEVNELGQPTYTIDVKELIPGSEWASIMAAVTPQGETSDTYWAAVAFHAGGMYSPQFMREHYDMIRQLNDGTYPHDLTAKG